MKNEKSFRNERAKYTVNGEHKFTTGQTTGDLKKKKTLNENIKYLHNEIFTLPTIWDSLSTTIQTISNKCESMWYFYQWELWLNHRLRCSLQYISKCLKVILIINQLII